jgi:hypothetical protein
MMQGGTRALMRRFQTLASSKASPLAPRAPEKAFAGLTRVYVAWPLRRTERTL